MGRNYALLGKQLAHSFSKDYFEAKFAGLGLDNYKYHLIETPSIGEIRQIAERFGLDGFNVTIPYKQDIIPFLDWTDPVATETHAVNTVKVLRNGDVIWLMGYNTDAPAFLQTLSEYQIPCRATALILGTGGAAQAVAWALRKAGIGIRFVSRHPHDDTNIIVYYEIADCIADVDLIVNATPVGMYPNVNASPLPCPQLLTPHHLCYDLIYNPSSTRFLTEASARGAQTRNGLDMLHLQAEASWHIWCSNPLGD